MNDQHVEEALAVFRKVLDWMAPAATDTVVARITKVALGVSVVATATSAATLLVAAPRTQPSAP